MNASNYLESGLLNHLFRSSTMVKPQTIAIALCTNIPVETDTGGTIPEVANANAYARVVVGAPSNSNWNEVVQYVGSGLIDNVNTLSFTKSTGNWGMVSGIAILDSGVYGEGNMLFYGALSTPRDIQNNTTFQFEAGDLDILCG